tara:strand:+ start:260 stop:2392 length:2133 start_codon:yes stop_codon:yes gene_type:complete
MKAIKHLILPLACLTYSAVYSTHLRADCTPDPVASGGTVTCTAVDADGFSSAEDTVTLDIDVAATVNGVLGAAISLQGTNAQVNNNGQVATATANTGGILLRGTGGRINLGAGASITTSGAGLGSYGINVEADGARIDLAANSSISASSGVAIALAADNAVIDIGANVTIDTFGRFGHSILALNRSGFTVNVAEGAVLTTQGQDARGIDLQSSNAIVNLNGAVVTNGGQFPAGSGDGSIGVIIGDSNFSTIGGELNISATGSITTSGDGAFGVFADGVATTVNIAQGATISAMGGEGVADGFPAGGIATGSVNGIVNNAGTISANPATLSFSVGMGGNGTVFNNQATGVINGGLAAMAFFAPPGSSVTLNNENIITGAFFDDEGSNQIIVNTGSIDSAFNSGLMDLGAGDDEIDNAGTLTGTINMGDGSDEITITAGSDIGGVPLMDGGDDLDTADGFTDSISFSGYIGNVADLTNWENIELVAGAFLELAGTQYTGGVTRIDGDSTLYMGLGPQRLDSALQLTSGTLQATGAGSGVFSIGGDTNNAALINAVDAFPGDTLTVEGNYTGGGGTIAFDTVLNDGSVSITDVIVIEGDAAGTTMINVQGLPGPGGLTGNGATDGIRIIEVRGASSPTAFALGAPVIAGAFTYELVQADGQNWYLQSSATVVLPPTPPTPPTTPGGAQAVSLASPLMMLLMILGLALLGARRA